ncbi:hypothetical protein FOCC_FOCC006185 [Frankliniella occidentalis]|nr:hypothetical protein FOCC_FOCC006185 [Frankliniella occidentalis]
MLAAFEQPTFSEKKNPGLTLSIAVGDARKAIGVNTIIEKVIAIDNRYSCSNTARENLHKIQVESGTVQHELKQNVVTRWNSEFLVMQRFLEQKVPITIELLVFGAAEYLGIAATEVQSEKDNSVGGNTVTSKRTNLIPQNVREILFLHRSLVIPAVPDKNKNDSSPFYNGRQFNKIKVEILIRVIRVLLRRDVAIQCCADMRCQSSLVAGGIEPGLQGLGGILEVRDSPDHPWRPADPDEDLGLDAEEPRVFRALEPAGARQGHLLARAAFDAFFLELALMPALGPSNPIGPAMSPLRPSQAENGPGFHLWEDPDYIPLAVYNRDNAEWELDADAPWDGVAMAPSPLPCPPSPGSSPGRGCIGSPSQSSEEGSLTAPAASPATSSRSSSGPSEVWSTPSPGRTRTLCQACRRAAHAEWKAHLEYRAQEELDQANAAAQVEAYWVAKEDAWATEAAQAECMKFLGQEADLAADLVVAAGLGR